MTMNNSLIITLALAALLIAGCQTNPQHEIAARVESLESFVAELEAQAKDPNAIIDWAAADQRFDQLYQPTLKSSEDQSLASFRKSQEYLCGRYAALRIKHASMYEIKAWVNSATETWQGFVEGLEDP